MLKPFLVCRYVFATKSHYYEIPLERFSKTFISPNAGRKSFYLTLTTTTGLVSVDADGDQEVK